MATHTNFRNVADQGGTPVDRRRAGARAAAGLVMSRAECLPIADREFLKAIFADGLTATQVARLQGCSAKTVYRRAQRLVARLYSELFLFVLRHRDQWPPTRRRIATTHFLHGRTVGQTRAELRMSVSVVRAHRQVVLALFEHAKRASRAA